jgi:hypothetical protein
LIADRVINTTHWPDGDGFAGGQQLKSLRWLLAYRQG